MAVKTITIDIEAYEALGQHKREGQSFSQVIKALVGRRRTGRGLKEFLKDVRLSDATIDLVEEVVGARRRSSFRAPKLC